MRWKPLLEKINDSQSVNIRTFCIKSQVLQSNQVKRFVQESRFGFVVQNLNPFFIRTSQIEIEKRTSRVKARFE